MLDRRPEPRRRAQAFVDLVLSDEGQQAARGRRVPRSRDAGPASGTGIPAPLLVPAAVGVAFLVLPLVGLLVRAPWSALGPQLTAPGVGAGAAAVAGLGDLATLLSLVLGVPLAWVLARSRIRGRRVLRALVTVPLVLPPVVGGVALFLVLGRQGIVGALAVRARSASRSRSRPPPSSSPRPSWRCRSW